MAVRGKSSEIFRQKSLDRVSSPENLDKYIKSTRPSLWLLLTSIILILVGILVWSVFGKLNSESVVGCKVEGGVMTSYITENDYAKIKDGSFIEVNGKTYSIASVTGPFLEDDAGDAFLVQAAKIEDGAWFYTVTCQTDLADGKYKGNAVFEQISPITFIIN